MFFFSKLQCLILTNLIKLLKSCGVFLYIFMLYLNTYTLLAYFSIIINLLNLDVFFLILCIAQCAKNKHFRLMFYNYNREK